MQVKQKLIVSLQESRNWFEAVGYSTEIPQYRFEIAGSTTDDWVLKVDGKSGVARFNPWLLESGRCSFQYFESMVVHENFHLLVQGLPNKDDARRVMRTLGFTRMGSFDVAADVATARFFKMQRNATLLSFIDVILEGTKIFGDPSVHLEKVDRFLGTLVSVITMYLDETDKWPVIFMPCLKTLLESPRGGGALAEISKNTHSQFAQLPIDLEDYLALRDVYTNQGEISEFGCRIRMVEIAYKAISHPVPSSLLAEIRSHRHLSAA